MRDIRNKTKVLPCVLFLDLTAILLSSCSQSFDGPYQKTDLPLTFAIDNVHYSTTDWYNNGVHTTKAEFTGTISRLSLGKHELLLASTAVTPDGKIATKNYGKLQLEYRGVANGAMRFDVLVTPKQERALRRLLAE